MHHDLCDLESQIQIRILPKERTLKSWNVFCVLCSSLTTHTTSFKGPTRNHHLSVCFGRASFDDSAHLIDHLVFAIGLILWQRLKRSASYVYFIISRRRHATESALRDETKQGPWMGLQQYSFVLLTIIQTPEAIDHKIHGSDFISVKLKGFFLLSTERYFNWDRLKVNALFFLILWQQCKHCRCPVRREFPANTWYLKNYSTDARWIWDDREPTRPVGPSWL